MTAVQATGFSGRVIVAIELRIFLLLPAEITVLDAPPR